MIDGYLCEGGIHCPHGHDSTHWVDAEPTPSVPTPMPMPSAVPPCLGCGHQPVGGWADHDWCPRCERGKVGGA